MNDKHYGPDTPESKAVAEALYNIDEDPWNADWLRRSWGPELPQNVDDLRTFLKDIGMSVKDFKASRLYYNCKDKVPWLREIEEKPRTTGILPQWIDIPDDLEEELTRFALEWGRKERRNARRRARYAEKKAAAAELAEEIDLTPEDETILDRVWDNVPPQDDFLPRQWAREDGEDYDAMLAAKEQARKEGEARVRRPRKRRPAPAHNVSEYPFMVQRAGKVGMIAYDRTYDALVAAGLNANAAPLAIMDNWLELLGAAHAGRIIEFSGVTVDLRGLA